MLSASLVPGVAPKLALEEIEIIPATSVVEPKYVFDPESVRVPEPTLINAPAPDITPETVSFPESPVVRVIEPASSTAPDPLKDCIVSVASTSYVPEFITSVVSAKVPDTVNVPAEIVVSPVQVLVAEKVKVPDPAFVKDPAPDITPETVSFPESPVVKVIPLANSTAPEPLKD